MCSIPYSLLTKADSNVLPQSFIQEHQNFCKLFIKAKSSYERKKEDNKNIRDSASFLLDKNKDSKDFPNNLKIWNWFENLPFEQKIKICTIKNKWLVKIIIQLYFIDQIDNAKATFCPIHDMNILFTNQSNYQNYPNIGGLLCKNIHIISNYNDKKSFLGYKEDDYCKLYFNIKENDFSAIKKDVNEEEKEFEKKFLDNIILLSLEDETLDTISLNVDFLKDIKSFKKILVYFSNKECFKDWLEPVNYNNCNNFCFPKWMHNNHKLSLCQILTGVFEQKILLLYEYFYYSKKIYEFQGISSIFDIYKENKKLEEFIEENYFYEGKKNIENFEIKKDNIITKNFIIDVITKIKTDGGCRKKFDDFRKMCNQLYNDYYKTEFYNGNNLLSTEDGENIYNELIREMRKEKGKEINLLLNKITCMKLEDVTKYREFIFIIMRRHFIDLRNKKIINELLNEDENKIGRKKKKKRKNKNKNINPLNTISNEDILNSNKIKEREKDLIKDNILNIDNINNNNENIYNINDGSNSSSSNDNYKVEETNDKIIIKSNKKKQDTSIIEKQLDNKDIPNENVKGTNNIEENAKETRNKSKNFFLFPLKNKKRKNKNKKNNITKEEKNSKKIENNREKEKSDNEEFKINEDKQLKLEEEKEEIKEKCNPKIIKNEEDLNNKEIKTKKDTNLNNISQNESKKEDSSQNLSLKTKNKYELSQISAISLQMLNEPKVKNDSTEPTISIEKQNQIEINKFYPKPETTTSFSYEPINKNENEENKNQVNMTINIINNQYIYQQYPFINNFPFMQFLYCYHIPSDSFFDLLTKEIECYYNYTYKNIEYLNKIRSKYLNKVEELIKKGLENKYKIKFGHYGSYFTNLSIEGSDIDILVYYKPNNPNFDFLNDIIELLNEHENEFDSIFPILSASVPVIKLQIKINKEVDNNIIEYLPYFEIKDLSHVKIDLTFTSDENEFKKPEQIVLYTNENINKYPDIKPLLLIHKRYFRIMKMNKSFTGGLSSFSLFLLILSFLKSNTLLSSIKFNLGKLLYYSLEKYSFFDYKNYGINVEGPEYYFPLDNFLDNNMNNLFKGFNNFENRIEEINILDPFTKLNVAKSSFQVDAIKNTFNKALFFFKYEAWQYDSSNYHNFNNNLNMNNNYLENNYKENDFLIIKKLFSTK